MSYENRERPFLDFDEWDAAKSKASRIIEENVEHFFDEFVIQLISGLEEEGVIADEDDLYQYIRDEITKREDAALDKRIALLGTMTKETVKTLKEMQ